MYFLLALHSPVAAQNGQLTGSESTHSPPVAASKTLLEAETKATVWAKTNIVNRIAIEAIECDVSNARFRRSAVGATIDVAACAPFVAGRCLAIAIGILLLVQVPIYVCIKCVAAKVCVIGGSMIYLVVLVGIGGRGYCCAATMMMIDFLF